VAWEQGGAQVVAISRDGGQKWSRPIAIGPVADIQDPIPGANFRTDSFPSIAADPRPNNSTLYAAWVNHTTSGGRVVVASSSNKGQTWSALQTVSSAREGYAFFQGLDIAPNGRVDIGYQALKATNPNTFGTRNATIDSYYVGNSGSDWSAPKKVTSASSDPAASAQNNLQRQFWGDYNTLVSTSTHAWFIYTDSRSGAGCAAVDAYQGILFAAGLTEANDEDIAEVRRQGPALADPTIPVPPVNCPSQFGNSDAYVSVITP
jgi:hypothetical protein